jgi:hypothetical protein
VGSQYGRFRRSLQIGRLPMVLDAPMLPLDDALEVLALMVEQHTRERYVRELLPAHPAHGCSVDHQ